MSAETQHLRRYGVAAFGRVGSFAKAKQSGRSRARRCWMITVWDDRQSDPNLKRSGKIGAVPVPRLGRHKTKSAAIDRLIEFAKEIGAEVKGNPDGYPHLFVETALEPELSREEIRELQASI